MVCIRTSFVAYISTQYLYVAWINAKTTSKWAIGPLFRKIISLKMYIAYEDICPRWYMNLGIGIAYWKIVSF